MQRINVSNVRAGVPACRVLSILLLIFSGCGQTQPDVSSGNPDSIESAVAKIQLNWKAESEHGGVYQAQADGTYANLGLRVDVQPGGLKSPIGPELQLERCQFAIANADDVVLLRNEGVDVVAVLAAMQNHPRCIMVRADSGIDSLEDLAGKTFQHGPRPFVEFMRSKGLLKDVKEVPYQGSIAQLVADPNVVMQAYSSSEPLLAEEQGVKVRSLMVSELGFNPYSSVLVTTGKLIKERPEMVRQFVKGTRQGWHAYLKDPSLGNDGILNANKQMTQEALSRGMNELRKLAMPGDLPIEEVGKMTKQRWETLVGQLVELELVDGANVKASECFTTEFID